MNLNFRPLTANEIECRAQMVRENGLSLLLYKDARCDQRRLDETVGAMNWQRHHSRDNANCIVSIWDDDKKQWVEKEDTGTESNTEQAKGLASDSFKRACFNWGIGRELYTAPFIWIPANLYETKNGKVTDRFSVMDIDYTDGTITYLTIANKKGDVVYSYDKRDNKPRQQKKAESEPVMHDDYGIGGDRISDRQAVLIKKMLEDTHSDVKKFLEVYKVSCVEEMTKENYVKASKQLNEKMERQRKGAK